MKSRTSPPDRPDTKASMESILEALRRCCPVTTFARMALVLLLVAAPLAAQADLAQPESRSLRIGIIGSGAMGGPLGLLWAEAGHQVLYSSRNPDQLMDLVRSAGPRASAGYPDAAAFFGEVILLAVPVHLGISLCMGMVEFGLVMLVGNAAFISPWILRKVMPGGGGIQRKDAKAQSRKGK